jgi:hypothetical protein
MNNKPRRELPHATIAVSSFFILPCHTIQNQRGFVKRSRLPRSPAPAWQWPRRASSGRTDAAHAG